MLIVLRGNSGSGRSTVARMLQTALGPHTALLSQDYFRRIIYQEREQESLAHADLLENAALHCLDRGENVILDGIFNAPRYSPMLERIAKRCDDARFFAFDLSFDETTRRHATRPKATEFSIDEMRGWYHGWQPLSFVAEDRITADVSPTEIVERIMRQRPR